MRTDAGNLYLAPSATATFTARKPTPRTVALALVCLLALLCGRPGLAAELHGRVVGVSDGDTITVLDAE